MQVMAGARTGGAETFFGDAIMALHEAGVRQHIVTRPDNDHRTNMIRGLGIPVDTASFGRYWRLPTARTLRAAAARFQPDIIQYWMGRAGGYAVPGPACRIGWYGGYYRPSRFKNCDFHVAVTKDIADHIVRQGIDSGRVSVLHTYASFENVAPVPRASLDTPEEAPLFLALARLNPKKGLDVLLKAMTKVPQAHLWIAGDGPLEKELKAQCRDLGLDPRVRFLGWRTDRGALLAAADICVFPSRYEPFGTVTVEAWGTGTPLIAAKAAGPMAYVTHEKDGLLVEIDDVEGLAAAMNRLVADSVLRNSLAAEGLKTYERGFSKPAFTAAALAFYSRILKQAAAE